ncbi:MAG: hypothetical protein AAB759_02445 [Patescibacteria group bacterium]
MSDEQQAVPASSEKMSQKKMMTIAGIIIAVVVIGGVASRFAGKSASERTLESLTGGKVNVDSGSGEVTVKTDEGTWVGSNKLPADFPSDVPLYPGAKVQSSVSAAQEQGGGNYVGLETSDAAASVASWYKAEIVANGWKVTLNMDASGSSLLGGSKDNRELMVTVSEDGGKTTIGIAVSQK